MARISSTICFLLLIVSMKESCEANPYKVIRKYYDLAIQIYEKANGIHHNEDKISSQMNDVSNQLDNINTNIENMKNKILETITDRLKDKLSEKIDTVFNHIKDIESTFTVFYNHLTNKTKMAKVELQRFALDSLSFSKTGLPRTVELMHEAFIDADFTKKESVISIIAKDSKAGDTMCIKGLSSQQLIYHLYKVIAKTDAKALMIKLFAYDIFKEKEKDVIYDDIKAQTKQQHLQMLKSTFKLVKNFMHTASREVWRCNPQRLEKGVTYEKLQVFQGYFLSKVDLTVVNKVHESFGIFTTLSNLFSYKCHHLKDERLRCKSEICKAQPWNKVCTGHVRDCKYIHNEVQVCHAPAEDDRRYIWAHLMGTDKYYADHSKDCKDPQGLIGILPENICYCNCESENENELRYFSLRESTSNIIKNKVVTGVQIVADNYVFRIRIQQGVLSKEGTIVGHTKWKKLDHIPSKELVKKNISKPTIKMLRGARQKYKNNLVYAVNYKQKEVFLDDFNSDGSKLVTGLRFRQVDDALRLEVRLTPFDYATGKLDVDAPGQWTFNPNKAKDRFEVNLEAPGDPKLSKPSTVFSKSNSYIKFRTTDLKKDVGQNTIPFIDMQSVTTVSKIPFPLSGVGLFHRHDEKTGGFLALKIHHFDYTPHIRFQ